MNLTESVYALKVETVTSLPKENEQKTLCGSIAETFRQIRQAPTEVKVLGVVGAICAFGSLISFGGLIGSAISSGSAIEKMNIKAFNDNKVELEEALETACNIASAKSDFSCNVADSMGSIGDFLGEIDRLGEEYISIAKAKKDNNVGSRLFYGLKNFAKVCDEKTPSLGMGDRIFQYMKSVRDTVNNPTIKNELHYEGKDPKKHPLQDAYKAEKSNIPSVFVSNSINGITFDEQRKNLCKDGLIDVNDGKYYTSREQKLKLNILKMNSVHCSITTIGDETGTIEVPVRDRVCSIFNNIKTVNKNEPNKLTESSKFTCSHQGETYEEFESGLIELCDRAVENLEVSRRITDETRLQYFTELSKLSDMYAKSAPSLKYNETIYPYLKKIKDSVNDERFKSDMTLPEFTPPTKEPTAQPITPPPHQVPRERYGVYAAIASVLGVAGGVLLATWARQTFLPSEQSYVSINHFPEIGSIEIDVGGRTQMLKIDEPEFKEKYTACLVKACDHSMRHGLKVSEVYEMAVEACDKLDVIIGNSNAGNFIINHVRHWFVNTHKSAFNEYAVFVGMQLPENATWVSGKNEQGSSEEMERLTTMLKMWNMV